MREGREERGTAGKKNYTLYHALMTRKSSCAATIQTQKYCLINIPDLVM